jgi:hypothetical protein
MAITANLDAWDEIRSGRADQAGADIYWLYCGIQKNDLKLIAVTLRGIITREEWRKWRWIGQEFECPSLRECLLRKPPNGVGADIELLKRLISDDTLARDMLDEALRNNPGRPPDLFDETVYNVHSNQPRPSGNSLDAMLRRLRLDDSPIARDLHAKVLAGELSAHRAAVLAGYRKEKTPLDELRHGWKRASDEERKTFRREIDSDA